MVDPFDVASECRRFIKRDIGVDTSCIESSYLFEQVSAHLGLACKRVVVQAAAYTPKFARMMKEGASDEELIQASKTQPGCHSVGIGFMQSPEDFVGRSETEKNRFVGHVVCIISGFKVGGGETHMLVDPSADQMHRPTKGLFIKDPVCVFLQEGELDISTKNNRNVVIRYILHPDVPPPPVKSAQAHLDRAAEKIAEKFKRK